MMASKRRKRVGLVIAGLALIFAFWMIHVQDADASTNPYAVEMNISAKQTNTNKKGDTLVVRAIVTNTGRYHLYGLRLRFQTSRGLHPILPDKGGSLTNLAPRQVYKFWFEVADSRPGAPGCVTGSLTSRNMKTVRVKVCL